MEGHPSARVSHSSDNLAIYGGYSSDQHGLGRLVAGHSSDPWVSRSSHSSDQHGLGQTRVRALFRSLSDQLQSSNPQSLHTLQVNVGHNSKPSSRLVEWMLWNISGNVGLVSAGRINKDTPPLTTPGHTSKSSAMDISSHIF